VPLILPKLGVYTLEEKRSRFLAYCAPAASEEEARQVIERIRVEHKGASHHVYAYSLPCNTIRFSDDGEPQGTAGLPVLAVFQKTGVVDFVCVVTRYFGGTLLGAGGLVRAYTKAALILPVFLCSFFAKNASQKKSALEQKVKRNAQQDLRNDVGRG